MKTWWKFNWMTVIVALSAVVTLSLLLALEKQKTHALEPHKPPLSCWSPNVWRKA